MDTEIPAEFAKEVEAHLAACRSCAMQLEALKQQSYALGTMPKLKAPGDLLDHVRIRLEKPPVLAVCKQWLQALFARKRFFQLAGAAATAALVIVTVQVALRDDGSRKGLLSPAPLQVESPSSPGSAPPSAAVQAPPTGPESLPDIRSNTGTAFKRSLPVPPLSVESPPSPGLVPSAETPAALQAESLPDHHANAEKALVESSPEARPNLPAGNETKMVALTLKTPGVPARMKTRSGSFEPESFHKRESFSLSSRGATGMAPPGGKMLEREAQTEDAGSAKVSGDNLAHPDAQKAFSSVIRLIERAEGKVLSAGDSRDGKEPGTLLAEVPGTNYPSFLAGLRQLGEVKFHGDKEVNPSPDANVRVSVSFDTRD